MKTVINVFGMLVGMGLVGWGAFLLNITRSVAEGPPSKKPRAFEKLMREEIKEKGVEASVNKTVALSAGGIVLFTLCFYFLLRPW